VVFTILLFGPMNDSLSPHAFLRCGGCSLTCSDFRTTGYPSRPGVLHGKGEPDHIAFAEQALPFFAELAKKDNFYFESTTHWEAFNAEKLKSFELVLWINDFPTEAEPRAAFQDYMEHGGAWLGFHMSAYNDESTRWPWFINFIGGGIFYGNNWPP